MDGWAVLAALKADPSSPTSRSSCSPSWRTADLGYALGAADYLDQADRPRTAASPSLRRRSRRGPGARVLIVEDDPATREVVRRMLEHDGWTVDEAENGRAALDRLAERVPALILLDLMMPEMDGFEFIAELRTRPAWRDDPDRRRDGQGPDGRGPQTAERLRRARIVQKGDAQPARPSCRGAASCSRPRSDGSRHVHLWPLPRPPGHRSGERLVPKILIVEDNEMNRDMLRRLLRRRGFEIVIAVDGKDRLAARGPRPGPDPDGHEPARASTAGRPPAASRPTRHTGPPDHRPDRPRDGQRPGEGPRGRLRRLRHQAHRPRPRLLPKIHALLPDATTT